MNATQASGDALCRCQFTRCIKRYCSCFQAGEFCNQECRCWDCWNVPAMQNTQAYMDAVKSLKFKQRGGIACGCMRSHCLKNYCLCWSKGLKCNEFCVCVRCRNQVKNKPSLSSSQTFKQSTVSNMKQKKTETTPVYVDETKKFSKNQEDVLVEKVKSETEMTPVYVKETKKFSENREEALIEAVNSEADLREMQVLSEDISGLSSIRLKEPRHSCQMQPVGRATEQSIFDSVHPPSEKLDEIWDFSMQN